MNIVDFLIHVHPDLSVGERRKLEADVGGLKGVLSAHFNAEHPHLLVIAHDPEAISSAKILEHVGERGVLATKIGL
ncbi:MAG: hypothetical protein HYU77_06620 [Betaproteobacteria bacterium]|nr:hypothetical protein [Betaproteobacteria bacterium]